MNKPCKNCNERPAVFGERYCKRCRKAILKQLEKSGYLTPVPGPLEDRPDEAREDTLETKFGVDR